MCHKFLRTVRQALELPSRLRYAGRMYQQLNACTHGILVQTYGDIEDGFDFEAMMEIESDHKDHFSEMYEALREAGASVLAIGAGCCKQCAKCISRRTLTFP